MRSNTGTKTKALEEENLPRVQNYKTALLKGNNAANGGWDWFCHYCKIVRFWGVETEEDTGEEVEPIFNMLSNFCHLIEMHKNTHTSNTLSVMEGISCFCPEMECVIGKPTIKEVEKSVHMTWLVSVHSGMLTVTQ